MIPLYIFITLFAHANYNSISNTLTFGFNTPANQVLTYNQLLQIVKQNLTVTNVTEANSFNLTSTDGSFYIQAPASNNVTITYNNLARTIVNGEQLSQLKGANRTGNVVNIFNYTISAPPSVFVTEPLIPSNTGTSGSSSTIPNVTFSWSVAPVSIANKTLSCGQSYRPYGYVINSPQCNSIIVNASWNINQSFTGYYNSITFRKIPLLNFNKTITPPQFAYNALYGINVSAKWPDLAVNKTLTWGGVWQNSNVNAIVHMLAVNAINHSTLQSWYNTKVEPNCKQTLTSHDNKTNTTFTICSTEGNNVSIIAICSGLGLEQNNLSQGLATCIFKLHSFDNQSAQSWHSQFNYEANQLSAANLQLAAQNRSLGYGTQVASNNTKDLEIVGALFLGGLIAYGFLRRQDRRARAAGEQKAHQ